jgi:hypothetical protein
VKLQALAQVQGTSYSASSTFVVPGSKTDFDGSLGGPPGPVSPFGLGASGCSDLPNP